MIFRNRNYPRACTPDMVFEELEARIVLDASVDHVAGHDASDLAQSHQDSQHVAMPAASAGPDALSETGPDHASSLNVVLISDSVKNADSIAQAAIDDATVIMYDGDRANLHSIVDSLEVVVDSTGDHISNLAIVDHAQPGSLQIGTDHIDSSNIQEHSADLEKLRAQLTEDGQIQLFGCSLAADASGKSLVNSLAAHTAANVFASNDSTGGPNSDWDLEYGSSTTRLQSQLLDLDSVALIDTGLDGDPPTVDVGTVSAVLQTGSAIPVDYTNLITATNPTPVGELLTLTVSALDGAVAWDYISLTAGGSGVTVTPTDNWNYTVPNITIDQLNQIVSTLTGSLTSTVAVGNYDIQVTITEQWAPVQSVVGTLTQEVQDANTPPVLTVVSPQTHNEATTPTTITGTTVTDADIISGNYYVELQVQHGTIEIQDTAALSGIAGNGTQLVRFTGDQTATDDALDDFLYHNDVGLYTTDTVMITVNDQGNTGYGGPQEDYGTITINIIGENDAPVLTVPTAPFTMNTNQPLVFSGTNAVSIEDIDAGTHDIQVTLTSTPGTIMTLVNTTGLTVVPSATQQSTMTITGPQDSINDALDGFVFQVDPSVDPNFSGVATIVISGNDNGWSLGGNNVGAPLDALPALEADRTITINVSQPAFWGRWPRGIC